MEGRLLFCSGICLLSFLTAPYTSMHVFLVGHKKKSSIVPIAQIKAQKSTFGDQTFYYFPPFVWKP